MACPYIQMNCIFLHWFTNIRKFIHQPLENKKSNRFSSFVSSGFSFIFLPQTFALLGVQKNSPDFFNLVFFGR